MVARNVLLVSRMSFAEREQPVFKLTMPPSGTLKFYLFDRELSLLVVVVVGQLCLLCERKERIVPGRPFPRPIVKHRDYFLLLHR